MDGTARSMAYHYDADGSRTLMTGPNYSLWFVHDGLGRMTEVKEGWNTVVRIAYDPAGRRSTLGMGNEGWVSSLVTYGYDEVSRLAGLTRYIGGSSAGQSATFGYNPASQMVRRTSSNDSYASNTASQVIRDYGTNGLNQYTGAVSDGVPSATFAYDANGNLISDGSTSFVYDAENRLVSASGARNANLAYDPLGRLWQVSSGANVTRFRYDGDRLIEEYNGSGTRLRAYAHGPGVDEPLIWYEFTDGPFYRYLHSDHQGSIVAIAGSGGGPLGINGYDEYGIPNAGNQGRFGYTGQAWLAELGMYYYKARFYSPTLGRFLQVDSIGYDDQINLYAYVANDPVNANDPTGEWISLIVRGAQWAAQKCMGNASCRGAVQRARQTVERGVHRIIRRERPEPPRRQPPNPYGSKGKPDHQREVDRQERIARDEAGPGETVWRESKARGMDVDRRPDVQTRDSSGKTVRVREVERHPDSKRVQDKRDDYQRNGFRCDMVDCKGNPR